MEPQAELSDSAEGKLAGKSAHPRWTADRRMIAEHPASCDHADQWRRAPAADRRARTVRRATMDSSTYRRHSNSFLTAAGISYPDIATISGETNTASRDIRSDEGKHTLIIECSVRAPMVDRSHVRRIRNASKLLLASCSRMRFMRPFKECAVSGLRALYRCCQPGNVLFGVTASRIPTFNQPAAPRSSRASASP